MPTRKWKKIRNLELCEKIRPEKREYLKKLLLKLKNTQTNKRGLIHRLLQKPVLEG